MKKSFLIAGALVLATHAAAAEPCTSSTGRSVTVNGSATLATPPDRVSFSVGVETIAPSVSEAFKANNAKLNAVLAALEAKGVQPKELQTSNLDISSRETEGRKLVGFRVANLVTVTREDTSSVGELIQAAVSAGANQAGGLSFFVADPSRLQARGLELAFQNARGKAEALAGHSKKALGDVVCVSEFGGPPVHKAVSFARMDAGPAVEAGTEQITFTVNVVFELK